MYIGWKWKRIWTVYNEEICIAYNHEKIFTLSNTQVNAIEKFNFKLKIFKLIFAGCKVWGETGTSFTGNIRLYRAGVHKLWLMG